MSDRTVVEVSGSTRETCRECGKSWGVRMTPRKDVLCSGCAIPRPWKRPAHYWSSRVWNFRGFDALWPGSPEWWDAKTSLRELEYAAELAGGLEEPQQLMLGAA